MMYMKKKTENGFLPEIMQWKDKNLFKIDSDVSLHSTAFNWDVMPD